MARYLTALQAMGVNPGPAGFPSLPGSLGPGLPPGLPPGLHPYPGAALPPSVLAGYPPELLQAYGITQPPPGSPAEMVARLQEARRLELEARKDLAKTRERSERSSPLGPASVKKLSSDVRDGRDSRDGQHLKLSHKLCSPAAPGRGSAVSSDMIT